jgi:ABC-type glycerol-3-phosphate transport system permease component
MTHSATSCPVCRPRRKRLTPRIAFNSTVKYAFAVCLFVLCVFPFFWIVVSSLKGQSEIFTIPPSIWAQNPTLKNYYDAISDGSLGAFTWNSAYVAVLTTLITTLVSMLCAYAIGFYRFHGRKTLNKSLLVLQLFPGVVTIIPLFIIFRQLSLINRPFGLVVGNTAGAISTAVILMLGYFNDIPRNLEEAARIDGANTAQVLFKIILPLAMPGIASAAIMTFINVWQEYFMALSFISDKANYTLPVGISTFIGAKSTNWGGLLATSVVIAVPALVLFVSFQQYFVDSLAGSVKG